MTTRANNFLTELKKRMKDPPTAHFADVLLNAVKSANAPTRSTFFPTAKAQNFVVNTYRSELQVLKKNRVPRLRGR